MLARPESSRQKKRHALRWICEPSASLFRVWTADRHPERSANRPSYLQLRRGRFYACKSHRGAYRRSHLTMAKPKRPEKANEFVVRAKTGDRAAQNGLLEYGAKFLRWYATQPKLRAPTRPSDVGANATLNMVKFFQNFQEFDGETIDKFEAWLVAIVTNEATGSVRQKLRRKTKAPALAIEEEIAGEQNQHTQKSPSANMGRREDYEDMYIAISNLPKSQSDAVYLKVVEGQSVPDIADQLGKTKTAVEGLIQRGIEGVRKQLAPQSNGAARKMTSVERQTIRTALSDYLQKLDIGEDVSIEAFVASRAPRNESLRLLLEWARRIRKVGGKSGVGGSD